MNNFRHNQQIKIMIIIYNNNNKKIHKNLKYNKNNNNKIRKIII